MAISEREQIASGPNPEGLEAKLQGQKINPVPPQYEGLPSEIVEELWQSAEYIDEEKNTSEKDRREAALTEIRQQELQREEGKAQADQESFVALSEDQRKEFPNLQQAAAQMVVEYIKGGTQLTEKLTSEETFVLDKVKGAWRVAQEKDPNAPLTLELGREIDQKVYANLLNKLAFDQVRAQKVTGDQERLDAIRIELGMPTRPRLVQEVVTQKPKNPEISPTDKNTEALAQIAALLDKRLQKRPDFKETYAKLLEDFRTKGDEGKTARLLMGELQQDKRRADYKKEPGYVSAWEYANENKDLGSKVTRDGWIYRGVFGSKTEGTKTETRGSLNVRVTPDVVKELDELIKRGVIKANYKFGDPDQGSSGEDRHDAITMYFLEDPSQEALVAISDIAKRNLRGNDLIGKKIAEGFYMSEIGSVSDQHAEELADQVTSVNEKLGGAVRDFLTGAPTGKGEPRVAMSEAQFYATKETLNAYGYDITYDGKKGFTLVEGYKKP